MFSHRCDMDIYPPACRNIDLESVSRKFIGKSKHHEYNHSLYPSACTLFMETKLEAAVTIFPNTDNTHKCILMLFTNIAEPEWISVNCSKKLYHDFLCESEKITNISFSIDNSGKRTTLCSPKHISKNSKCYLFVWHNLANSFNVVHLCKNDLILNSLVEVSDRLKHILKAVSVPFHPLLFFANQPGERHSWKLKRYLYLFASEKYFISNNSTEGYHICVSKNKKISPGSQLFQCADGMYISQNNVCDGNVNCFGSSTDEFCMVTRESTQAKTRNPVQGKCPELHYESLNGVCQKFYFLKWNTNKNTLTKHHMTCNINGTKIDLNLKDDLVADCGPEAQDELILLSLLNHKSHFRCKRPYQIPCKSGHPKCYNITDICTFSLDLSNHLHPCRTGGHLELCDAFQCNMMFKCYKSYCVPWSYLCDGKWDCPYGNDELYSCGPITACPHLYSCRASRQCIHVGTVCDNTNNCPSGDDEEFCELKNHICPQPCQCLLFAMKCCKAVSLLVTLHESYYPHVFIDISFSDIRNIRTIFQIFPSLNFVILTHTRTQHICQIFSSGFTIYFDVSFNLIESIAPNCLTSFLKLNYLNINNNKISCLATKSFVNATSLQVLCLSNNPLQNLPYNIFADSTKIKLFHVRNVTLKEMNLNAFTNAFSVILNVTDYHICCIAPSRVNCTSAIPWVVSCGDILPTKTMRTIFIVVSVLILVLSGVCFLSHILDSHSSTSFKSAVVAVNLSHILMITFLSIVWISDILLEGTIVLKEEIWRSGTACFTACQFVLWYSILSQLTINFLSLSRMMVVIYPIDTKFKGTKFTINCLIIIFLATFMLSISIVLGTKFTASSMPTLLCIPFFDPAGHTTIVTFVIWCVVIMQMMSTTGVTIMHIFLVNNFLKSQNNITKSKAENSPVFLITQLSVLTTFNILCWISSDAVFLTAMFLPNYPSPLVTWTSVAILPINSISYPAIFVVTQVRKYCCTKQKKGL